MIRVGETVPRWAVPQSQLHEQLGSVCTNTRRRSWQQLKSEPREGWTPWPIGQSGGRGEGGECAQRHCSLGINAREAFLAG